MKQAEQEAKKLRESLDLATPVNVEKVAEHLGLGVLRQILDTDVSAMLVLGGRRGSIVVNSQHSASRQRFSIAHECGHYVLHRDRDDLFVDGSFTFYRNGKSAEGSSLKEIQANAFAAEILMPEEELRDMFGKESFDLYDEELLRRYASRFAVSPQALAVRLVKLGLAMQ